MTMDFGLILDDGNRPQATLAKQNPLINAVLLSLHIRKGAWFLMPGFGSRLHEIKTIADPDAGLARQYVAESLQWLIDTKKARSIEVTVTPLRGGRMAIKIFIDGDVVDVMWGDAAPEQSEPPQQESFEADVPIHVGVGMVVEDEEEFQGRAVILADFLSGEEERLGERALMASDDMAPTVSADGNVVHLGERALMASDGMAPTVSADGDVVHLGVRAVLASDDMAPTIEVVGTLDNIAKVEYAHGGGPAYQYLNNSGQWVNISGGDVVMTDYPAVTEVYGHKVLLNRARFRQTLNLNGSSVTQSALGFCYYTNPPREHDPLLDGLLPYVQVLPDDVFPFFPAPTRLCPYFRGVYGPGYPFTF